MVDQARLKAVLRKVLFESVWVPATCFFIVGAATVVVHQLPVEMAASGPVVEQEIADWDNVRKSTGAFPRSENDPAFEANGDFTAAARAARCPAITREMDAFSHRWLDHKSTVGIPESEHAIVIVLTQMSVEHSYMIGCATRGDVYTTAKRMRYVAAKDASINSFTALIYHAPIWPLHRPHSFAQLEESDVDRNVGEKAVDVQMCQIDKIRQGVPPKDLTATCGNAG